MSLPKTGRDIQIVQNSRNFIFDLIIFEGYGRWFIHFDRILIPGFVTGVLSTLLLFLLDISICYRILSNFHLIRSGREMGAATRRHGGMT